MVVVVGQQANQLQHCSTEKPWDSVKNTRVEDLTLNISIQVRGQTAPVELRQAEETLQVMGQLAQPWSGTQEEPLGSSGKKGPIWDHGNWGVAT